MKNTIINVWQTRETQKFKDLSYHLAPLDKHFRSSFRSEKNKGDIQQHACCGSDSVRVSPAHLLAVSAQPAWCLMTFRGRRDPDSGGCSSASGVDRGVQPLPWQCPRLCLLSLLPALPSCSAFADTRSQGFRWNRGSSTAIGRSRQGPGIPNLGAQGSLTAVSLYLSIWSNGQGPIWTLAGPNNT